MKPVEYTEDKPKKQFQWGYLYKVYLVILIAVFLLALANQANAGVFLEINGNMDYYESQMPLSSITQDSDTWDAVANYMNDVHGVPFPSYSEATQMDDLLENVLMYYVGQYCNLSGTAAQQVYDTCMDITDAANTVWDLISLDLESGDFIATPNHSGDLSNVIHGAVDPIIYTTPSQGGNVVGNWFSVPCNTTNDPDNGSWKFREYMEDGNVSAPLYACSVKQSNSSCLLVFASFVSGQSGVVQHKIARPGSNSWQSNGSTSVTLSSTFQGSESLGYYGYYGAGYNYLIEGKEYTDLNTALGDLFGTNGEFGGDPYLNGEGYIIDDDPTYSPLSGYSALNYPYRTKIVENHTDTTDPDDPVGYPHGVNTVEPNPTYKDVPTWLVDPTVDIPEEPDYLENVDVELPEIEPDTGFITDCYNALPSGIVSMIAVGLGLGVVMKIIS